MTLFWRDTAKGLQSMTCANSNPAVLRTAASESAGTGKLEWDGRRLRLEKPFEKGRKRFIWRELVSNFTRDSLTRTADTGENGKPLKRWVATTAAKMASTPIDDFAVPRSLLSPVPQMRKLFALLGRGRFASKKREPLQATGSKFGGPASASHGGTPQATRTAPFGAAATSTQVAFLFPACRVLMRMRLRSAENSSATAKRSRLSGPFPKSVERRSPKRATKANQQAT